MYVCSASHFNVPAIHFSGISHLFHSSQEEYSHRKQIKAAYPPKPQQK